MTLLFNKARRLLGPLLLSSVLLTGQGVSAADCPPVAQMPTPEALAAAQREARDRGVLWRLDKDGRSSYLFGTIHLGNLAWAVPGPRLREALQSVALLAVEVDITDAAQMADFGRQQQRLPALPLEPADEARLQAAADAACVPRQALSGMHPMLQVTTLTALAGRRDGLDPAYAQEGVLIGAARALGRPVVSLESMAAQLAVLVGEDAALNRRMLRESLQQLEGDRARRLLRRMGEAWAAGDLALIASPERLCDCQPSDDERAFMARLNDARNPALARRIAELHAQGQPLLAAVGVLHMTGPQSLPRLLQEQGFQLQRLVP